MQFHPPHHSTALQTPKLQILKPIASYTRRFVSYNLITSQTWLFVLLGINRQNGFFFCNKFIIFLCIFFFFGLSMQQRGQGFHAHIEWAIQAECSYGFR
mmetsp:Transcript_27826/g.47119  ORF Transcript_27826/g.47119 Transcript_27826/m.47119 type:complete len:99 (-) Transcript_27826:125-421(-)